MRFHTLRLAALVLNGSTVMVQDASGQGTVVDEGRPVGCVVIRETRRLSQEKLSSSAAEGYF